VLTFLIDKINRIMMIQFRADLDQGGEEATRKRKPDVFAHRSPGKQRLVKILSRIAGIKSIGKFTDRKSGNQRIWKAICPLMVRPSANSHAAPAGVLGRGGERKPSGTQRIYVKEASEQKSFTGFGPQAEQPRRFS
jgi:hypothetical protein